MSSEAADREAATSSRPCTPPQTSWFEFLLEESLLETHLHKPCPGKRGACAPKQPGPGTGGAPLALRTRTSSAMKLWARGAPASVELWSSLLAKH